MVKTQRELVDVIREAELKPLVHQPLPTHTPDGVLIDYKPICYFHRFDPTLVGRYGEMFIHLEDRTFRAELIHDIPQEDIDHGKRVLRYGICRPCAERLHLVAIDDESDGACRL